MTFGDCNIFAVEISPADMPPKDFSISGKFGYWVQGRSIVCDSSLRMVYEDLASFIRYGEHLVSDFAFSLDFEGLQLFLKKVSESSEFSQEVFENSLFDRARLRLSTVRLRSAGSEIFAFAREGRVKVAGWSSQGEPFLVEMTESSFRITMRAAMSYAYDLVDEFDEVNKVGIGINIPYWRVPEDALAVLSRSISDRIGGRLFGKASNDLYYQFFRRDSGTVFFGEALTR